MSEKPTIQTPLSPEQEQQAVDALTALDWNSNELAGRRAVVERLALTDVEAEAILTRLRTRRIVRRILRATDVIEDGPGRGVSPMRWERAGVPTTLEVLQFLTGLSDISGLENSRQALCQHFGIGETEANALIHEFRDRNLLAISTLGLGRCQCVRPDGPRP